MCGSHYSDAFIAAGEKDLGRKPAPGLMSPVIMLMLLAVRFGDHGHANLPVGGQ
jgi:hypothetical protein